MKKIIDVLAKNNNIKDLSFSVSLHRDIQKNWHLILGDLSKRLYFRYCRYKCLYITTANPAWRLEISVFEKKILSKLYHYVPKASYLKSIRVIISNESPLIKVKQQKNNKDNNISVLEKIKAKNLKMKADGYVLCSSCEKRWTSPDKFCSICRCSF